MNIFQKFEAELNYQASYDVHKNDFNTESYEGLCETASLRNWLWINYSIWVVVRLSDAWLGRPLFIWEINSPAMAYNSNGKNFKTAQQAYMDSFQAILNAHDFIQHQQTKQQ
jgi:hypothetical protein